MSINVAAEFIIGQKSPIETEYTISKNQAINTIFTINATPSKVSQLENDLNFQTKDEVEASINEVADTINARVDTMVQKVVGSELIDVSRNGQTVTLTSNTFVFEQAIAATEWYIVHNLNKRPSIQLVDTSGRVFEAIKDYISNNEVIIRLSSATTGFAYLN